MATTKMPAPGAGRFRAGRVVSLLVAVVAGAVAFLVIGALVARLVGEGPASWALGYVVATVACLGLPVFVGVKVAGSEAKGPIVIGAVAAMNVVWALLVLGLAPTPSRAALHSHGTWWLCGIEAPALSDAVAACGDAIPGSDPPVEREDTSSLEDTADAGSADAGVEAPPGEPEGVWTASDLFARRADSVVTIQVRSQLSDDDPLREILEDLGMQTLEASGSGFVVSPDGLIVTNHHVIGRAVSARVTLRDGRTLDDVRVLALDPSNDLGLLQIDATDLPVAPLGNSENARVGATVFACGSPLGLDHTLTQGIVSAIREESGTTFVQTQAPIAPGSSGGPLFDDRGRVIGVNTASRSAGLNFAVRIDHVRALLEGPRLERRLERYGDAAHATSVEVEGAPIIPTARMTFEALGVAVANLAAPCIHPWPDGESPVITVNVPRGGYGSETILTSDRGDTADSCLSDRGGLIGMEAAMVAREASDGRFAVTVTVAGIGAGNGHAGHTAAVRFVRAAG